MKRVEIHNAILYHGDCLEILPSLESKSVDAVITDPPYGIGIDHWDVFKDVEQFTQEVKRICKGFYTFFGQMPAMAEWQRCAIQSELHFCEHVFWIKRNTLPSRRLGHAHESILIYSTDNLRNFFKVRGSYADIKLPSLLTGAVSIKAIDRYIKDLQLKVAGKHKPLRRMKKRKTAYARLDYTDGDRSAKECNFTNVWSFLPPACKQKGEDYFHATRKPIEIMERLIEMLAPEAGIICDPFMGSGTTGVACAKLGYQFIGIEKDAAHFDIACRRIEEAYKQPSLWVA